jgi:hypothetical protein
MNRSALLAGLLLLATAMAAEAAQPWSCSRAGFHVEWSGTDIVAGRDGAPGPGFSARAFATADYTAVKQDAADLQPASVGVSHEFRVLSLAGPLLGLRDEQDVNVVPSAHPGGETALRTIDLRSSQLVALTDLFQPNDIRSGLLADPFLKPALDDAPPTPEAIVAELGNNVNRIPGACASAPDDLLARFAIVGGDSTGFLVRIGLPGAGPCRYNLTQVGLHLPARGAITGILPHGARDICVPPPNTPPLIVTLGQ